MSQPLAALRRFMPRALVCVALLGLATWVGCSDDDDDNPANPGGGGPTTSSFTGWMASPLESGSLAITVNAPNLAGRMGPPNAPRASVTSSGTLTFTGSAPIDLTGTLDDATGDLALAGGGYTLTGFYDPGPPSNLFGSYAGPNGDGAFDCYTGGSSSATVMCGLWTSNSLTDSGSFTFTIRGSAIEGVVFAPGSLNQITFTGTVSGTGTSRPVLITATLPGVYTLAANGTLDTTTNTITDGTYTFDDLTVGDQDDAGTWDSGLCD